jgi:hypothetical protein
MAVEQLKLTSIERHKVSSIRALGIIGMIGSPALLIEKLLSTYTYQGEIQNSRFVGLLGIIYIIGWACSLIGLRRLKVLGKNVTGRILFFMQFAGVSLAVTQSVMEIANPNPTDPNLLFQIADAAWPLSHLFMIVVGIYVLASGVWKGWRSVTPLLCGLALPTFFALAALGARNIGGYVFGLATTITFMLLGNAVRTSAPNGLNAEAHA